MSGLLTARTQGYDVRRWQLELMAVCRVFGSELVERPDERGHAVGDPYGPRTSASSASRMPTAPKVIVAETV
ncbi:hypothetical protein GCM10028832_03870 [Streptomyces sparsus]